MAFWKGRLIPYASVGELKHLQWKPPAGGDKPTEQEKLAQQRTVMLLFFNESAQVDATKFNLRDDLMKVRVPT